MAAVAVLAGVSTSTKIAAGSVADESYKSPVYKTRSQCQKGRDVYRADWTKLSSCQAVVSSYSDQTVGYRFNVQAYY